MAKRSKKGRANRGEAVAKIANANQTAQPFNWWLGREWIWGVALLLGVALVYYPVIWAGYIWDDDYHVTANPCIIGPLGLKEIWTTQAASICPLVLTTFWIEHALWGLAPLPYHLVTLLLHAACAVLFWQVLRALQVPGAWLGAALWALHPVQVESVAWISEMKNTQSGLFYLLTILFYVKWLRPAESGKQSAANLNYALTLLFAALAIASKFSTAVLPMVLALCAWWCEGRWQWRRLPPLAPILLMSIIAAVVTLLPPVSEAAKISDPQWERSWPERIAGVGDVIWFYLGKLVWPHPLLAIYPRGQIDAGSILSYLPLLVVVMVTLILWLKRDSWMRCLFFAWAYFLIALSPFLGLVDQSFWRYSFVEDHLQYLASMGPLALAGAGMIKWFDVASKSKVMLSVAGVGILLLLGMLSWRQTWLYENEETLWNYTLAHNPDCAVGYNDLGLIFLKEGQMNEAIADFQRAVKIDPYFVEPHNNLGFALMQTKRWDGAIAEYQKTLYLAPGIETANFNLGNSLAARGRMDEAMTYYETAFQIDPSDENARYNYAVILLQKGRNDEAAAQFKEVLRLKPDDSDAQGNLARAQALMSQKAGGK